MLFNFPSHFKLYTPTTFWDIFVRKSYNLLNLITKKLKKSFIYEFDCISWLQFRDTLHILHRLLGVTMPSYAMCSIASFMTSPVIIPCEEPFGIHRQIWNIIFTSLIQGRKFLYLLEAITYARSAYICMQLCNSTM